MGKILAIGAIIVIIALIIAGVSVWFRRKYGQELAHEKGWAIKGDLNAKQEKILIAQLEAANDIFAELIDPNMDLGDDITILKRVHRANIEAWLVQNSKIPYLMKWAAKTK